jgi:uncharacterized protein YjbI with pentapeptide repeats
MANEEQLKILKNGVPAWNKWREENYDIKIDLQEADLRGNILIGVNFSQANLVGANLCKADLRGANFQVARLSRADLNEALLNIADFEGADLEEANLREADIHTVNLSPVNLTKTDLRNAKIWRVNFWGTTFKQTKLNGAEIGLAIFGNNNLWDVEGLDEVNHTSASTIGADTIKLSNGKIPEKFLRGCGLSDWEIESVKLYQPGLSSKEIDDILYRMHDLRAGQALQINSLFISYSHKDSAFVDEMENHLNKKGIRFWRDIHNATAGRLEKVVDRAMRQNPTVLLVLSENSVQSDWVEHEARSARELEKEFKRDVLCPVALDGAWKDCNWPARLREQIMEYNILDFSNWKDDAEFTKKFAKLVEGLDLFYKE